jgi:DNA-binding HxlR family transcriptional regulator
MTTSIHLGYEVGSGRGISVPLGHLVVTGQTQKSGKTTTLEALITRSSLRAVAFVTKRGEKSFRLMTPLPPYFRERADWQFVQSILEATMKQKMDFKQAWIMRACDGAETLEDVQDNIQLFLKGEKETTVGKRGKKKERWIHAPAKGLNADMYYVLNEYLEEVLPELRKLPSSKKLELRRGVNVMDLSPYSFAMQALVIRSVLEEVYLKDHGVIVIIPEAWEFIPEGRRSPVRLAAEELIRKGAAEKNYVWLDSQDIAGVAKVMLRQMEVWIFGVQRDSREIKRVMDSIPNIGGARAGLWDQIATMGKGQFIVAHGQEIRKVYVQPAGMEEAHAQAIARGEERPESWTQIVRALDEEIRSEAVPSDDQSSGSDRSDGRLASGSDHPGNPASDSIQEVAGSTDPGEDEMWKEKYEALEAEHKQLVEAHDELAAQVSFLLEVLRRHGIPTPGKGKAPPSAVEDKTVFDLPGLDKQYDPFLKGKATGIGVNGAPSLNDIWLYVKKRATSDPLVLQLLREQPELQVKVTRNVIEMTDRTLAGQLAVLIHKGFFESPTTGQSAFNELQRLGKKISKPNVYRELDKLADLGFVTKEDAGYQVVKTMKVNIAGAGR